MCRAGDLDIALLNAVVSALSRAAQWQQARVKNDLRFMVLVVLVEKNHTLSWESKRTLENSIRFIYLWNCTCWDVQQCWVPGMCSQRISLVRERPLIRVVNYYQFA